MSELNGRYEQARTLLKRVWDAQNKQSWEDGDTLESVLSEINDWNGEQDLADDIEAEMSPPEKRT